jgi:hypothetical protein
MDAEKDAKDAAPSGAASASDPQVGAEVVSCYDRRFGSEPSFSSFLRKAVVRAHASLAAAS